MPEHSNQLEFNFHEEPTESNAGLAKFSADLQKNRQDEIDKINRRNQRIEKLWGIPPIGKKVKICFNQKNLGIAEGIFRLREDPKYLETKRPPNDTLVFYLETDEFELAANGPPTITEYLSTDIGNWEAV